MQSAIDLLVETLKNGGFDGLFNPNVPCGCGLDNLMPYGEMCDIKNCLPAYAIHCAELDGYDEAGICYTPNKNKE